MNIPEQILSAHNRANAESVAALACSDVNHFSVLMECFLHGEKKLAQRAAWSVNIAAEDKPAYIQPYIADLLHLLNRKDVHPAVVRNALRILHDAQVPKKLHGELMNTCFDFVQSNTSPVAVKVYALMNLQKLSNIYPDIKRELQLIVIENWDKETAAFRARGRRSL